MQKIVVVAAIYIMAFFNPFLVMENAISKPDLFEDTYHNATIMVIPTYIVLKSIAREKLFYIHVVSHFSREFFIFRMKMVPKN
ncbi:MAG: hypothetical protein J7K47_04705 [Thermoplasmata archaeon]|nr:hypothetical protein [Thermoplasmata archaeon]